MNILISGPMCSGTRLLTRLVAASGEQVEHDTEHGQRAWPTPVDAVIVILRDPTITRQSWEATWNSGYEPELSRTLIQNRYPLAIRVTYEALVADPQTTLDDIADALRVPRWECPELVYDGNARWVP